MDQLPVFLTFIHLYLLNPMGEPPGGPHPTPPWSLWHSDHRMCCRSVPRWPRRRPNSSQHRRWHRRSPPSSDLGISILNRITGKSCISGPISRATSICDITCFFQEVIECVRERLENPVLEDVRKIWWLFLLGIVTFFFEKMFQSNLDSSNQAETSIIIYID